MISDSLHFDVIELRRYALRPGRRDELIALFERSFIESQEACGMVPFGHYRDFDDDDRFVWLRGFPNIETRRNALEAFYVDSRAWRDNRDAANETMIDSDDVFLLRPARTDSGFDLGGLNRPGPANRERPDSRLAVSVLLLERAADDAFLAVFEEKVLPALHGIAQRVAYFVTDPRPNEFPRLPVREGEFAFVAAGVCPTLGDVAAWSAAFEEQRLPDAMRATVLRSELHRLAPASRSLLR